MVGGVSILFDVNDIGSGIKDAVEGGDNDIAKDLSTEMGGETGAMVYDGVNIIVGWASVLESLSNLKKVKDTAEAIKDISAAGKGSTESTKDTMDFIKDHIDGEDNK